MIQTNISFIRDQKYRLQARIGRYPDLYYKIYARRYPFSEMAVREETNICIEGFPRSANSYAVAAFKLDNAGVKPGHHLHVPAQILRARKLRKPVIAVIREPLEAVASFLVFQSSVNADLYLKLYRDFYKALIPYREEIVTADFKTVISDFNSVIVRVNQKYGTAFNEINNLKQRQNEIYKKLDEINRRFFAGSRQKSMFPDKERETVKELARQRVLKSPAFKAAQAIYLHYSEESEA